jgi:hypothetical protein
VPYTDEDTDEMLSNSFNTVARSRLEPKALLTPAAIRTINVPAGATIVRCARWCFGDRTKIKKIIRAYMIQKMPQIRSQHNVKLSENLNSPKRNVSRKNAQRKASCAGMPIVIVLVRGSKMASKPRPPWSIASSVVHIREF